MYHWGWLCWRELASCQSNLTQYNNHSFIHLFQNRQTDCEAKIQFIIAIKKYILYMYISYVVGLQVCRCTYLWDVCRDSLWIFLGSMGYIWQVQFYAPEVICHHRPKSHRPGRHDHINFESLRQYCPGNSSSTTWTRHPCWLHWYGNISRLCLFSHKFTNYFDSNCYGCLFASLGFVGLVVLGWSSGCFRWAGGGVLV